MWNKDESVESYNKDKNRDLKMLVGEGEKVLYEGKPNKRCYVFESIFNPMLPFALIWFAVDVFAIGSMLVTPDAVPTSMILVVIIFMLFHLMPVWIYAFGIIFTFRRYRNTYYIVTDRAIYTSGGVFARTYNSKPFAELSHIDLHRGIFDQLFKVGDIIATSSNTSTSGRSAAVRIDSVADYEQVYKLVKKLQQDIYSDVMYPNDLRPKQNKGYKTEYVEDDKK